MADPFTPYGYYTDAGYRGRMPNGDWQLFPTDKEYKEELEDESHFVSSSC